MSPRSRSEGGAPGASGLTRQGKDRAIDHAVETLIRSYGPQMMRLLLRVLRQSEDAEDAYQETWCAVWRSWPQLEACRDPWPYLRTAAMRKAIDRRRTVSRGAALDSLTDLDPPAPAPPEAVDLSGLAFEERAALALYFWEGLSVREIAAALRVPEGTVKTWMYRARGKLRSSLVREGAACEKNVGRREETR